MEEKVRLRQTDVDRGEELVDMRNEELNELNQQLEEAERRLCRNDLKKQDLATMNPEDFMDMICKTKNRLQLQEMRNAMLMRERNEVILQSRHVDRELENLECLYLQIRAATGFSSQANENWGGTGLNQSEQELAVKELCFLIVVLKKELGARGTLVAWKDDVVTKFQRDVARQMEILEKQAEVVKDINTMDNRIREADEALSKLGTQHLSTDRQLTSTLKERALVSHLDCVSIDVDLLKAKAQDALAVRKTREAASRLHNQRLNELADQFKAVQAALENLQLKDSVDRLLKRSVVDVNADAPLAKDFVDTGAPPFDAELYQLLSRNHTALKETVRVKRNLVMEKDCVIEATTHKLNTMLAEHHEKLFIKEAEIQACEHKIKAVHHEVLKNRQELQGELGRLHSSRNREQQRCDKMVRTVDRMFKAELKKKAERAKLVKLERSSTLRSTRSTRSAASKRAHSSTPVTITNGQDGTPRFGRTSSCASWR